ncbi:MAG: hypothetical protein FGM32_09225 [Candidatus Kapabacteria bacterium]|nr:hypothetical protein [Candidatus Kapabacteria bacterium]
MTRFIAAVAVFLTALAGMCAQQLIDAFEVTNRSTRPQAVLIDSFAIVHRSMPGKFDPAKLRLRRCDTKAEVPFYLEPWKPGTDSVLCWVRFDNVAGNDTIIVLVELDPSIGTPKSSGSAVFLSFRDTLEAPAGAGPSGPWSAGIGSKPDFGRGLYIDARITALNATGGYFCYFGNNTPGTDGYVIKHDARQGSTEPDHLRINGGTATPLANGADPATFVWDVGETVRYNILLNATTNAVYRISERSPTRRHRAAAVRDAGLEWTMFGVASFPQAPRDLGVSYVRARPVYDFKPRSLRRGAGIAANPLDGVLCSGSPVVLQIPGSGWRSIKWSTGETTPSITVTAPGSYWADLTDGTKCTVRTTPFVVSGGETPNAGNDTTITLCLGASDSLQVAAGYAQYEWYISWALKRTKLPFTGPVALIDSADVYRCIVRSASGCTDTVKFVVNRVYDTTAKINTPFINPTICEGDSLTLQAFPPQAAEFKWSKSGVPLAEKSDRLVVRDSGTYTVLVRIGNSIEGCLSLATVKVNKAARNELRLAPLITVCQGDSAVLDADGFTQAEWWRLSKGKQTQLLANSTRYVAKTTDTVLCIASVNGACADSSVTIIDYRAAPPFVLRCVENKKSICRGEYLTLSASITGFSRRWFRDGQPLADKNDSSTIQIDDAGTYTVTVDYGNTCKRSDSIMINSGLEPPDLVAIDGVALCPGATTRLTTLGKFTTYRWSTGETTDTIVVDKPGVYTVDVSLFGCESKSSITIELADPKGPGLVFRDSTTICPASQFAFLVFTNTQSVPRQYNVEVLDKTLFEASTDRFTVGAKDTGSVGFRYIGSDPPPRFVPLRAKLSDDCNWVRELVYTIENRYKPVPLEIVLSTPTDAIRSGDDFTMRLAGPSNQGLADFTSHDTLWIETSLPPDLFEITSATASCGQDLTILDEAKGRVRYTLTNCSAATANPLIEQKLSTLVGETLQGFIRIDSITATSPCISVPMASRRIDMNVLPYGCEINTITRSRTIVMGIGNVADGWVTAVITRSTGQVTVRAVDVLGRVLDSVVVPSNGSPQTCRLDIRGESVVYVSAIDASSMVTIPVSGASR